MDAGLKVSDICPKHSILSVTYYKMKVSAMGRKAVLVSRARKLFMPVSFRDIKKHY